MGDRAIVLFSENGQLEPFAVYFHWAGDEGVHAYAAKALADHAERKSDISYFAARFVQTAANELEGSTGIGLLPAPTAEEFSDPAKMREYSHGDAGVCIFEPAQSKLTWIVGTGYGKGTHTFN